MATISRGQIMGRGMTGLQLDPSFFEALENQILWAERVKKRLPYAMNDLVRAMAMVNLGYAQRYAAGPVDPQQRRPELAWQLPVRRITGRYFFGWKIRYMGVGWWQLYNDSREAFYIEFGIHRNPQTGEPSGRRIRRPVQKLSLMRTLEFLKKTRVYDRIWASIYVPPPGMRRGRGFIWHVQSAQVMQDFPIQEAGVRLR